MKVFIIIEDQENGGVNVTTMPQLTVSDIESGLQPFGTLAGQTALAAQAYINQLRANAEKAIAAKTARQKGLMGKVELKKEPWKCLH